jgi:hypothetical protein
MCLCSESREALVEAERSLLQEVLALLESACPALEERSLLVDALKQLDELFLLVVVGEFNSGKSSVRPLTPPPMLLHVGSTRQRIQINCPRLFGPLG